MNTILVHATHTHSSPDITGEFYRPGGTFNVIRGIMFGVNRNDIYIVWITHKIVKMVQKLINNLKLCKIAWIREQFNPNIVINRRHPKRISKPYLGVISFRDLETKDIIGMIVSYACHPTTLSRWNNKLSADYPGRIIQRIVESTQRKIKVIYFNGPSGDLNPITTYGNDFDELSLDKTPLYDQKGNFTHTEKMGYIIADEALKLSKLIPENDYFEDIDFQSYVRIFQVPLKDFKYYSKKWFSNKVVHLLKKHFILPIAKLKFNNANFSPFDLGYKNFYMICKSYIQIVKVKAFSNSNSNEFCILTVPGELFEDIGNKFLNRSPLGMKNTFIFQNTNDWIGYLFTREEYIEEGGYEPGPTFAPLCGFYVEREMEMLFKDILKSRKKLS